MRDEEVSKGRECICPELNRNRNIGEVRACVCVWWGGVAVCTLMCVWQWATLSS